LIQALLRREASGFLICGGGLKSAGNGYLDTEDADGNGVLDSEGEVWTSANFNTSTYLTSGSTAWKRITLDLSATDRAKLTAVSGLRLVLKATNTVAAGRVLVGRYTSRAQPFPRRQAQAQPPYAR
jgi:hypothetical protein